MITLENLVDDLNELQVLVDNAISYGWAAKADRYLIEMDVTRDLMWRYFERDSFYDSDNEKWIAI